MAKRSQKTKLFFNKRVSKKRINKKKTKSKKGQNNKKTKSHIKKVIQLGGGFPDKIKDKILAIGEKHYASRVSLQDIIRECKQKPEYHYHIFSEMELGDTRYTDGNVTVIPEMEYIEENDEENLKCAMSFLVNTFPYMKQVLDILQFQFSNERYSHLDTYDKCIAMIPSNMNDNIEAYIGNALSHRLREKYFRSEPRLFSLLQDFYSKYKTAKYRDLQRWFDEIIDICINKDIFIPVLELTNEYKKVGKNRVRMINPLRNDGKRTVFDDETKYVEGARGKGKWMFGWPFLLRDMLHSNRIERYIDGLSDDIKEKSIYIVHKGHLHFELRREISPIRYFMKMEFVGEQGEERLIEDLIRNTTIRDGKLMYPARR